MVGGRLKDREPHRDLVEERRVRQLESEAGIIVGDVEQELVLADLQVVPAQDRRGGPAAEVVFTVLMRR